MTEPKSDKQIDEGTDKKNDMNEDVSSLDDVRIMTAPPTLYGEELQVSAISSEVVGPDQAKMESPSDNNPPSPTIIFTPPSTQTPPSFFVSQQPSASPFGYVTPSAQPLQPSAQKPSDPPKSPLSMYTEMSKNAPQVEHTGADLLKQDAFSPPADDTSKTPANKIATLGKKTAQALSKIKISSPKEKEDDHHGIRVVNLFHGQNLPESAHVPSITPVIRYDLMHPPEARLSTLHLLGRALGALGVIFGDLGTSPLYVFSAIFNIEGEQSPPPESVLGCVSVLIWTITIMTCLKYLTFIFMADNHGEGGIFSLLSLIPLGQLQPAFRPICIVFALIGCSLVIGDGVITPAISVLSAIEGILIKAPELANYTQYIGAGILLGLFMVQRFGTNKIGLAFGPIMLLWFLSLLMIGIYQIIQYPAVFAALNPGLGIKWLADRGTDGFLALSTVVLCVTGVEALYADMGHFGKTPIRLSWYVLVYPALVFNYLGQASLLVRQPSAVSNPFFFSVPAPVFWPMLILATFATIIASQSMISGAMTLIDMASRFQCFPRVKTKHTNENVAGQVYVPELNYFIMVLCITVCLAFQHSARLTYAYGVAVSGDMFIENLLFIIVMRMKWRVYWGWIALWCVFFLGIDVLFLTSNLVKVPLGGWLPLTIGVVMATMMIIWYSGRSALINAQLLNRLSVDQLIDMLEVGKIQRAEPGSVGVFMSSVADYVPPVLTKLVSHMHTLPFTTILLTIKFVNVPFVEDKDRMVVRHVGCGVHQTVAIFGYGEQGNVRTITRKLLSELKMAPPSFVSLPPSPLHSPPGSPPSTPRRNMSMVDLAHMDSGGESDDSRSGTPLVRRRNMSHVSLSLGEHEAGEERLDEPFSSQELPEPDAPPSLFSSIAENLSHHGHAGHPGAISRGGRSSSFLSHSGHLHPTSRSQGGSGPGSGHHTPHHYHHHPHSPHTPHHHHHHSTTYHEAYPHSQTTFYLARERIVADKNRWVGHRLWVTVFDFLLRNTRSAASVFRVPAEGCVEIGTTIVL
eukprot:TRINITY_DN2965_c0_g1_i8.p1 TRINITY_DN2965_c0_g1~~TRINITY_DN2965_c0_g1_i8.p1  ORF type:complete len:1025 (+),score=210.59 TRINITY_DN2965_c0_g1_i8:168-3242(+)